MTAVPRWTTAGALLAMAGLLLVCPSTLAQGAKKPRPTPKPASGAKPAQTAARPPLDAEIRAALKAAPSAKDYPNDDWAALIDLEDVTVAPDGTTTATFRYAFKVLTEGGKRYGDVARSYTSSYEDLQLVYARTIRKDGSVVYVDSKDVKRTSVYSAYPLYDDSKVLRFSMPAVEEGCVIEYAYREVTRPKVMPGHHFEHWSFASYNPVLLSRLRMTVPKGAVLKTKIHNADKLKPLIAQGPGDTQTYTWEMRDFGTVDPEPSMPSISEIRPWMQISSLDSWKAVGKWFRALQKPQAASTPAIRAAVTKLIEGAKDDDEKAKRLYEWVSTKVRYVAVELGQSAYQPHRASEVYGKLYGDCKDKANLLITMLAEAGIKADPVLLSAGDTDKTSEALPSPHAFDHCIALAHVGGKDVWLDATATSCAYGDIPQADRGSEALVVTDDGGSFVTVPTFKTGEDSAEHFSTITLAADGSADAEYRSANRGNYAQAYRRGFRDVTPDQLDQYIQRQVQQIATGATLKAHHESDPKVNVDPYEDMLAVHAPSFAKKSGDMLMLTVSMIAPTSSGSPFSKEKRVWPIVQECDVVFDMSGTVNLPEGFEAIGIPEPVHASCALLDYERTITKSPDGKSLKVTARCHYKPGRAPASDYAAIRDCFNAPAKADEEQIVLRKKQ